MELYLFVVVILFGLAISDLIVGVSNDAVNFLNSAVGSKVAPRYVIMTIASIGMLLGVTFSSGMMEVARKGIFHPEYFIVTELLIIFLAVMVTDIILLDLYNTFGLPTSTTVSIVFELFGSAVAISFIKIHRMGQDFSEIVNYINTDKALAIITGILLSIIIAFSVGAIIQYFSRLLFTFDFEKKIRRYGAIWGGLALMAITYFIIIKGAKGASWLTPGMVNWINTHTELILLGSLVVWSVIFQALMLIFRVNVLKIIVLIGTGALAMAFAANDLVNFIGVPLAGFHAFKIAANNPSTTMEAMAGAVRTDTRMLLVAGAVMVVTLWFSRKAQTVTRTEIGLGRQDYGEEKFEPSVLSRAIVRMTISLSEIVQKIIPNPIRAALQKRFDPVAVVKTKYLNDQEKPSFDLIRASVNLMVASTLISLGTSLKLPLSTTYVTFMVAMGSSLSDRAWGRESAVYRISGVLTVIGGWFFTAFMAFTVSLIFATLIFYFKLPAILGLIFLAIYFVYHTHKIHKKAESREVGEAEEPEPDVVKRTAKKCTKYFGKVANLLDNTINALMARDRKALREIRDEAKALKKSGRQLVSSMFINLQDPNVSVEVSPRIVSALNSVGRHLFDIADTCFTHVENEHRAPTEEQAQEIRDVQEKLKSYLAKGVQLIEGSDSNGIIKSIEYAIEIKDSISNLNKLQIKRIKRGASKTRQSMLYLNLLIHSEEIIDEFVELLKGYNETFNPTS